MTTWILLRGLMRDSRHWGGFVDEFQHAMPHSRVLALDLPGNGALHRQASPGSVPAMVAHCRAQLLACGIQPPYALLAMSLGAMVAVAWSAAHPHEVSRQVLINTSLRPFSPFYQRLRPANYRQLLRLALLSASAESWERAILNLTSNHACATPEAILPQWLAWRQTNPVSRVNALRQLVAAARYQAALAPPLVPTLLLASEQDRLVSVACSKALARHWHCALRLHPSAGHDLPLDDPTWVAAQVRSLLLPA
jgi:pimeloyl-ACP methyl ester carboxylesterase